MKPSVRFPDPREPIRTIEASGGKALVDGDCGLVSKFNEDANDRGSSCVVMAICLPSVSGFQHVIHLVGKRGIQTRYYEP